MLTDVTWRRPKPMREDPLQASALGASERVAGEAPVDPQLVRRLQDLHWPSAEEGVKERVLRRVFEQVDAGERSGD